MSKVIGIRPRLIKWGIFLSMLGMVVAVCLFSISYFQLIHSNLSLAQLVCDLQKQTKQYQADLANMQTSLTQTQESVQKTQELLTKQERILDSSKWYVTEAQYLVRLANDHLQLAHNIPLTVTLLQRAEQVLQPVSTNEILELRKSITTDISNLQAIPQVDTTALYLQLAALNAQLEQLPMPAAPLKASTSSPAPSSTVSWWRAGLQETWNALHKIVIVRYNTAHDLALVMPEEKPFLYQNLHAQMESAMWAVLHRNEAVYQTSLDQLATWIPRYFDQDAMLTQTFLQNLHVLQKMNIQPPKVNLTDTLKLFDQYFAQTEAAQ
ncbi:MAG: hypothetical protein EPO11_10590 [Gammaproteobacteria bacterium]|nr:MAG: hypothetical protein EPO11_10590 [Gammaproteobacteria bacterium]